MKKLTLHTQSIFTDKEWNKYAKHTFGGREIKELALRGEYARTKYHGDGQITVTTAKIENVLNEGIDNISAI